MFEAAEIAHKISKADYRKALPELRKALLDAQAELHARKPFAVILLVSGQDGAGKSETINTTLRVDGPALPQHPGLFGTQR